MNKWVFNIAGDAGSKAMRGIAAAQKAFKNLEKSIGAAGLEPTTYTYFLEIILKVIYANPPSNNKLTTL